MVRYDSIDLTKFIASIFVVAIHTHPLILISESANYNLIVIARFAVPFFLITSSFFLFKKLGKSTHPQSDLKKYLSRIGWLYLSWFIISLPITIYNHFFHPDYNMLTNLIIFIRDTLFSSSFSGSWYLVAMVYSILLVYFLSKKVSNFWLILLGLVFYSGSILASSYYGLIENTVVESFILNYEFLFSSWFNGFPAALIYVVIGKIIAEKELRVIKLTNVVHIFTILGFMLMLVEMNVLYYFQIVRENDSFISLVPFSILLFISILKIKIELTNAVIYRNLSTIIYFSHFNFVFAYTVLSKIFNIEIIGLARFGLVLTSSLVLAVMIIKLEKVNKLKFLRFLY